MGNNIKLSELVSKIKENDKNVPNDIFTSYYLGAIVNVGIEWFKNDKKHYDAILNLLKDCSQRRVISKSDVEDFLEKNKDFQVKKFVDFFDEDVKKKDDINVDYTYLLSKILEVFINNFTLNNKLDYLLQAVNNGEPNTDGLENVPLQDKQIEEVK